MMVHTALRVFLLCLILCAGMILTAIWIGEHAIAPVYFQSTATVFIIGLASFLIWFSLTLRSIYELLRDRS